MSIQVTPNPSFSTEKVTVEVKGLPKNTNVTLYASTVLESNNKFESFGLYTTDENGDLSLLNHKSKGGTYRGVEPMGFLWAMVPSLMNKYPHARFVKKDCRLPLDVTVKLFQDHLNDFKPIYADNAKCLAETIIERNYLPSDIEMEVLKGEIKGYLFVPKSIKKLPGVINLYGASAGTFQAKPAALASQGFVVLALIYLGKEYGLPEYPYTIDLDYFEKAVEFLRNHPRVNGGSGIGINSISTGTCVAFAAAAVGIKGIKCVSAMNGSFYTGHNSFVYKSREVWKRGPISGIFPYEHLNPYSSETQPFLIPFHKVKHVSLLYFASLKDQNYPVARYADQIEMLCKDEERHNVEVVRYADAGHLIEIPYTPLCKKSWFPVLGMEVEFGGIPKDHANAQIDSWYKQIDFFKRELQPHNIKSNL